MEEFRRLIVSIGEVIHVILLIAVTLFFGFISASFGAMFGMGFVGFLLGATAGFVIAAAWVSVAFTLSEIAANTRRK